MYKFFQENIYTNLTFFKTRVHNNERAHNSQMCNEFFPSCILARSDCASSAKSIAFDDCSDMSEKIIQVTVPC